MLDPAAGVRPLIGVVEAQFHVVDPGARTIDEVLAESAIAHQHVVIEAHRSAIGLKSVQLGVGERAVFAVQMSVGEITDILDDERVVCRPGEVDRDRGPGCRSLELRQLRHRRAGSKRGVARKNPDQAVALANRKSGDTDLGDGSFESLMRDADELPVGGVRPAVVGADQLAAFYLPKRKLNLAMRATILQSRDTTIRPAEQRDQAMPETGADDGA